MDPPSPKPVHLLCLMHGMWGNPIHLSEASRIIREKADSRSTEAGDEQIDFDVLLAQTNRDRSTYDGIDWGGERIADEICEHVEKLESESNKKVTKFSVLGYSLGGLLGRYVIGILQARKFFDKIEPVNFNTIATPHIGLPRYPGSIWSSVQNALGPKLLSRTGEQFFAVDQWGNTGLPLLEVMASSDSIFLQTLKRFPNISIYANAVNDLTVPYVTASISEDDPYINHEARGLQIEYVENYKPLVASFTEPDTPPPKPKGPPAFSKEWFISIKEYKPPVPPFLNRPFPLNLVLLAAVPILIPTFICFALVRLSIDSRASRARIKLLEKDSSNDESGQQRLINLLWKLEKEMDDVVADLVDNPGNTQASSMVSSMESTIELPESSSSSSSGERREETTNNTKSKCTKTEGGDKNTPVLKPSQKAMVKNLNAQLTQMKKYTAYIHPTRNSHATIVSRDVVNFEFHRLGEGVLRHWADGFRF